MKIEGYISKKTIRFWLDNYEALVSGDRPLEEIPGNTGPKNVDGISAGLLNKTMLENAVDGLPGDLQLCVKNRWYYHYAVRHTCNVLGITSDDYYSKCNEAVEMIYNELNGFLLGVKQLMKKIYN